MRARLGAPKTITAAAHKLARILYHLLTTREPYDETLFARCEERHRTRTTRRLQWHAAALGSALIPLEPASGCFSEEDQSGSDLRDALRTVPRHEQQAPFAPAAVHLHDVDLIIEEVEEERVP